MPVRIRSAHPARYCLVSMLAMVEMYDYATKGVACVASVSVKLGSKERPRNGIFGVLPYFRAGKTP